MTEFEEYLRGTFEINNGIENDVDSLLRLHAPELLRLAKKELMKGAIAGKVVAVRNVMSDRMHTYPWIEVEAQLPKNDRVKVIIIKE